MQRRPVVALVTEAENRYCNGLLRGVLHYVRSHRPWSLFVVPIPVGVGWPRPLRCDGIICDGPERKVVETIRRSGIPMVEMDQWYPHESPYLVASDNAAIARAAAEHLLDCGLRQFGFVGFEGVFWSRQRREGFVAALGAAGCDCAVFESPWTDMADGRWNAEQCELARWLRSLRRPVGVMACNDRRGQQLLMAAQSARVPVPEEVAVIGVDDDLVCELCDPPLSSVVPNTDEIGFAAAALLDRLLAGETPPREWRTFRPRRIVPRESTDLRAVIEDQDVALAVRHIREHACYGVTVSDVLRQLSVSRAWLERRFRKYLGHSPQTEIRAAQVRRVQQLLVETDRPLTKIAELTGFNHPEYMGVVFKRMTGQTPGDYRREVRSDPVAADLRSR
jgi:LacI family transcriptional regulator